MIRRERHRVQRPSATVSSREAIRFDGSDIAVAPVRRPAPANIQARQLANASDALAPISHAEQRVSQPDNVQLEGLRRSTRFRRPPDRFSDVYIREQALRQAKR